jgi:hypothetical protein
MRIDCASDDCRAARHPGGGSSPTSQYNPQQLQHIIEGSLRSLTALHVVVIFRSPEAMQERVDAVGDGLSLMGWT